MMTIEDYIGNSAYENITRALALAKKYEDYNAIINLTEDRALQRARDVDDGKITGKLAGVPFAIKDNILAFGAPTTAASHMLEDFTAPYQATAVERLEAEGAICIGKTNLDSFGYGSSTENSAFGPTKNAVDTTRVAGGSSGGSAAVVALDIVPFSLGTDTGGSIRQPASFNGVYGLKPTYGAVSRYGVISFASSTDVVGCFAHTPGDAARVMEVMAGQDTHDMTSLSDYFTRETPAEPITIGVVAEFIDSIIDEDSKAEVSRYISALAEAGHTIREIHIPEVTLALPAYYTVTSAEAASNLARFDGIRYGKRARDAQDLTSLYENTRRDGFELEAKRRILFGNYIVSSDNFDTHFQKAQRVRTRIIEKLQKELSQVDVLIGSTTPAPAFHFGEYDAHHMRQSDILLVSASLAGLPALSVPAGKTAEGLPVGVQLIGAPRADMKLLSLAESMDRMEARS